MITLIKNIVQLIVEYFKNIWPYWKDFLVILVGLVAYLVYNRQKRDEKRSAATMVICQIDIIEKRIARLKDDYQLGNIAIFQSKSIMESNQWEQHKHKLIKNMTATEYELIQNFFDQAFQLEIARREVISNLRSNWNSKTIAMQEKLADICLTEVDQTNQKIDVFFNSFSPLDVIFRPNAIATLLKRTLDNQPTLLGTTAYKRLEKISYR